MDQDRDQLREVADARERVAQDVRSVAENANVVQRAKETVQGKVDDTKSSVTESLRSARDKLSDARDNVQTSMQTSMQNVRSNIGNTNILENPVAMLVGGIAVGFLIGMVLPVTRFEAERIGPIADDMKDRVRGAGTEVMRRGGEVIKETIDAGRQAATNSLKEQARDIGLGGDQST
jgi:ElaB/YqjD/DUF883 family membrane-anchored ribosome-binding protein